MKTAGKIRIAFFKAAVLEEGGGLEKYFIETASKLSGFPGVTADIITLDDKFSERLKKSLTLLYFKNTAENVNKEDRTSISKRLSPSIYYTAPSLQALRKLLQGYDIVYSKNELLEAFILKLFVQYGSIPPVVFGGHTPLIYPYTESSYAKLHNLLYSSSLYRYLAKGVKAFHAINNYEQGKYKNFFPRQHVWKIYNPFDAAQFQENSSSTKYPLNYLDQSAIPILWVGRLTEQKGISDLCKVIEAINSRATNTTKIIWTICGDGNKKQLELIRQLCKRQLNVHHLGHIEHSRMASIYQQHRVLLSTSKWEGYPYSLIEPQAFGLQIFAYNIPGVSDILSNYDGGHLSDSLEESIQTLNSRLRSYSSSGVVPLGHSSKAFKPEIIYGQLLNMFREEA
jgi:glycosyltransferase involved in cell wall biosynthesis